MAAALRFLVLPIVAIFAQQPAGVAVMDGGRVLQEGGASRALGLAPGGRAVASFNAAATRVLPR